MQLRVLAVLLFATPALAQSDQYWQQVCAMKETQSNQILVNLLKQLDDNKKEIDSLKKQLEGKSESKPHG
jgi:hypothetical protein